MRKQVLPKVLRVIKYPVNPKIVWDFFRGANVNEKLLLKVRNSKYCSNTFEYRNNVIFKNSYNSLNVGSITGIAICAKSHLYKVSFDWLKSMRNIRLRVFVGILLNKSTNGSVHNIILRCKIAKAFFIMRFNLNSPNVLSFFSDQSTKKNCRRSSLMAIFKKNVIRRALHNKYGSYNKR